MRATDPIFHELRNGLLWHCTSPEEFTQIRKDGLIRFNDCRDLKYGEYACHELGGVSLFDFTSETVQRVIESSNRWEQFLGCARPVTLMLGLDSSLLPGR